MIKLKNILIEKKFDFNAFRGMQGFNTTMKLFKSKSFQAYAKDRYDININDIFNQTEKNKDGTFNPGTTNEEVIQMMIDRFYYLQKNNWSAENATVIILLKNVRQMLAKRLSRKIDKVKKYNEQAGTNTDK